MSPATAFDSAAIAAALHRYWGFDRLRPLQAEAIQAGLGQRDSLVVLPTGGGKSLCYQLPAVVAGRTDVVISPLISLMKDQVDGLRACGYPAAALHTGVPPAERREIERDALAHKYNLLFAAPERLQSPHFGRLLERLGVRAFAIDEAHCISHWGHDFRQEYRQLAVLRERFPQASLHAFTATATQRVRDDIVAQLCLRDPAVLVGCFDRPNLVYRIVPKEDVHAQVGAVLGRHAGQAAIVYRLSRADTEAMAESLRARGFRAAHYHAGLDAETRRRTQDAFADERLDIVVATVAFGMGIDRSDVRCVIHGDLPKSLEHYQQETGRAGRDGLEAECVLFYSYADVARWEGLIDKSAASATEPEVVAEVARALLKQMQRFCAGHVCRHRALSEYFGQTYAPADCRACDVCLGEIEGLADATETAQKVLSCVARIQERFGVGHVVDVLTGAQTARVRALGHDRLSTFGLLRDHDKKRVVSLVHQLCDLGLLDRTGDKYPVLKLNAASWEVLRGRRPVHLRVAPTKVKATRGEQERCAGADRDLFEALRGLRRQLAQESLVPPFVVFHDTTLHDLARLRPTTMELLERIPGFGRKKLAAYGHRVLETIRAHCQAQGTACDRSEVVEEPTRPRKPARPNAAKAHAFELFDRRAPVAEVVARTGRAPSTVWQYLAAFVGERRPADVSPWVDAATYDLVRTALRAVGEGRLRPVYEHLGGQVPYERIRLVMAHVEATHAAGSDETPGEGPTYP